MRDFRIDECECWVGATTLEADHACLGSAVLQPCTLPLLPSCSWSSGVASELRSSVIVIAVSISNGVQVCIAIRYLESASGGVSSFRICYMARRRALARLEGSIQARPIGKWINTQERHRQRTNHIHQDPIKKTKSRPRKRARNIPPNARRERSGRTCCHVPLQRRKSATAAGCERSLSFFDCSPVQVSVRRNPRDTIHSDSAYRRGCNPSRTHSETETESQGGWLLFPSYCMAGLLLFYREKRSLPAYARQDTASHTLQGRQYMACSKLASFQRLFGNRPSGVPRTLLAEADVRPSQENPLRPGLSAKTHIFRTGHLEPLLNGTVGLCSLATARPLLSRARRAGPKERTDTTLSIRNPSVPSDVHRRVTYTTWPSSKRSCNERWKAGVQILRYVATWYLQLSRCVPSRNQQV
jgi:hypothetical protein